jgi:hypothetical protein
MHHSLSHSLLVSIWWVTLSAIGVMNIILWAKSARRVARTRNSATDRRGWYLGLLSAGYVFGCAFRSFVPRVDVERYCLLDSWISSIALGRSVATVAELCFVAQWALTLNELACEARAPFAIFTSYVVVPLIAIAEVCSWYAVTTTNFVGNVIEESIWTLTGTLLFASLITLLHRFKGKSRQLLALATVATLTYLVFMVTVDVPMYFSRWRADETAHRIYFTLAQGFQDVAGRWIPTGIWEHWRHEIPWMTLYFSVTVWISIALMRPRKSGNREIPQNSFSCQRA